MNIHKSWLIILCLLILSMVLIGGFTRLSGSGLSMTKWHPKKGILPPISSTLPQPSLT
ncbi:MAG TPA: COX15/CtaA family protein, partial [Candidatus Megaira endosymbiont of Hartmannula sinica]|nr:COX15/CtaA family protein [Candidatus Megaera endosymbiont of Hartmannula sinica]